MSSFIEIIQNLVVATATTVASVLPIMHFNDQNQTDVKYVVNQYKATKSANQADILVTYGQYTYLNQSISYSIQVPKNGGEIKGEFNGPCTGTISGLVETKPKGSINGILRGKCKLAFIEQDILGHYSGNVDAVNNKVTIDWLNDGNYGPKQGSVSLDLKSH